MNTFCCRCQLLKVDGIRVQFFTFKKKKKKSFLVLRFLYRFFVVADDSVHKVVALLPVEHG